MTQKRWITSDWHLGESGNDNLIRQRYGFVNAQHMIDEFVEVHNRYVEPEDLLYFVGDAVGMKHPEFLPQVERFNGRKILFRGNHDAVFSDDQLLKYFDQIIPEGDGMEIQVDDIPCWITHYPTQSRKDKFNLVGHVHAAWKVQLNALNVGVDVNHYKPHNIDIDIPFYFTAISKYFDKDIWVAYEEHQSSFIDQRGVSGCYFDKVKNIEQTR